MLMFTTRETLDATIRELITKGKTFSYRKANELDGFEGWILFI